MPSAQQTVTVEVEADMTADALQDDYGVPGSPTFTSFDNVDVDGAAITINGTEYTRAQMKAATAWDFLRDILIEAADEENWSGGDDESPDYDD